jgi:hypothetical protein
METVQFLLSRKKALTFTAKLLVIFMLSPLTTQRPATAQEVTRDEQINRLLVIVRDADLQKKDPDGVTEAIQRLGQLRAARAVGDLIRVLTFRPETRWDTMAYRTDKFQVVNGPMGHSGPGRYPAIYALVEIGRPTLPALVEVIETNGSQSVESTNARYAVREILRAAKQDPRQFLDEAARKAPSPEARQRLVKAAETADDDWKSD